MITGSKELIREINNRLVLENIISCGPISRANIAKKLGLTKSTVSSIVNNLLTNNIIIELGSFDTDKGRKPILISFNENCAYAITIDIDNTKVFVMLSNLMGHQACLSEFETPASPDKLYENLISHIKKLQGLAPSTTYGLVGISIGIHGVVHENEIIFCPYYDFGTLNIKTLLEAEFNVSVFLDNEANLSVMGEYCSKFNHSNIASISVHSGVGLGLILNSKLYTGYSGYAGELGHTIISVDGRPCPCGNCGCLEQYCSERVLLAEYSNLRGLENISFEQFSNDFRAGKPLAIQIMDKFTKYMTICVNNILNTYNPEIVIINSSFTKVFPELSQKITNALSSRMNSYSQIVPSTLQENAILLGGICVIAKNYLKIERFHFS